MRIFLAFLMVSGLIRISAEVTLNEIFSDHMVLQRGVPVKIYGMAKNGEKITVEIAGKKASATAQDERWEVRLEALSAGGPHKLIVKGKNTIRVNDVLIGDVWICGGQSNMAFTLARSRHGEDETKKAKYEKIRLVSIPRNTEPDKKPELEGWQVCSPETAKNFSAVGYYFGVNIHKNHKVPVGLISCNYGGSSAETWMPRDRLAAHESLAPITEFWNEIEKNYPEKLKAWEKKREEFRKAQRAERKKTAKGGKKPQKKRGPRKPPGPNSNRFPGILHTTMLGRVIPFTIRGAIWYQGESNANGFPELYRKLFPAMIGSWRRAWGLGNFPFLFVQLPGFKGTNNPEAWPLLRESQLETVQKTRNTGMAISLELGEKDDIHPKHKRPVGKRLALLAGVLSYGKEGISSGPLYKISEVKKGKIIVSFDHTGKGLILKGKKSFQVCGEDKKFVDADVKIKGNRLEIWNKKIKKPVAARYAWGNFPEVTLWNKDGIPASPFRTDPD